MNILIDTNVLLDFFLKRADFEDASIIMNMAARNQHSMCIAAHAVTTLGYFMKKTEAYPGEFRERLHMLLETCRVLPVDKETLSEALASPMSDYEDAVMEAAAFRHGVDFIVTRDKKDFKYSRVTALDPSTLLKRIDRDDIFGGTVREPAPSYHARPRRRRKATT